MRPTAKKKIQSLTSQVFHNRAFFDLLIGNSVRASATGVGLVVYVNKQVCADEETSFLSSYTANPRIQVENSILLRLKDARVTVKLLY